jgi:hypothetical protein
VQPGEKVGHRRRTGSGKRSAGAHPRVVAPDRGSVRFAGKDEVRGRRAERQALRRPDPDDFSENAGGGDLALRIGEPLPSRCARTAWAAIGAPAGKRASCWRNYGLDDSLMRRSRMSFPRPAHASASPGRWSRRRVGDLRPNRWPAWTCPIRRRFCSYRPTWCAKRVWRCCSSRTNLRVRAGADRPHCWSCGAAGGETGPPRASSGIPEHPYTQACGGPSLAPRPSPPAAGQSQPAAN